MIFTDVTAQKKNVFDCPIKNARVYQYTTDGFVKPRAFISIDTGSMIVFKLGQWFDCCGGNHCAAEGKLIWAIDKESTFFNIKVQRGDSLKANMTYYMVADYKFYKLVSAEGEISGRLVKNKWLIEGKMRLYLSNLGGGPDKVIDEVVNGEYTRWKKSKKNKNIWKFSGFD